MKKYTVTVTSTFCVSADSRDSATAVVTEQMQSAADVAFGMYEFELAQIEECID